MIRSEFVGIVGSEPVGFSHRQFRFVVHAFHRSRRIEARPVRNQFSTKGLCLRSIFATFFIGSRRDRIARRHQRLRNFRACVGERQSHSCWRSLLNRYARTARRYAFHMSEHTTRRRSAHRLPNQSKNSSSVEILRSRAHATAISTERYTRSHQARKSSAVSFHDSRCAQLARNQQKATVDWRLPSAHGTRPTFTLPQCGRLTRRIEYTK